MSLETVAKRNVAFQRRRGSESRDRVMQKYFALTGFRLPGKTVIMIAPSPVVVGELDVEG